MHILICSLNSKYIHSSLSPWYLRAAGREAGFEVEVREMNINQKLQEVAQALTESKPDLLAFSCYIWNIESIKALLPLLKEALPATTFVLGGPEVSFNPREVLETLPMVNFLICGEGEKPWRDLLLALDGRGDLEAIEGLCRRQGASVLCRPMQEGQETPPSPFDQAYFNQLQGRIAYLESSRGCPFSCSFCLSGRKGNVRFFDLERTKGEILKLAASGSKTIKFVDRTFNCHPGRTRDLVAFILDKATDGSGAIPEGVCFHLEVGADLFQEETLSLFEKAPFGLFQMEAGLQSFYGPTLEAIERKTNLEKLEKHLMRIRRSNKVHIHVDLIAGLPWEDLQEFGRSFNRAFELRPHMLQLGFLKLLHGSRIRAQAVDWGYRWNEQAPYEFLSNQWMDEKDKLRLSWCEDALDRLYNSGRFLETLEYLLEAGPMKPFELFCSFGEVMQDATGTPLDTYTEAFYLFARQLEGVEAERLRGKMIRDRLRTDNTGSLPTCLKREDPRYQEVAKKLSRLWAGRKQAFRYFGFALTYENPEGPLVLLADYRQRDPVTGHYLLESIPYGHFLLEEGEVPCIGDHDCI